MKTKLTIIIITYNSEKYIQNCIKNITKYPLIIIDNNSQDNTLNIVKNAKNVKIIANKKNLGFSKAANIALKQSRTKYALILNPDIIITNKSITKMVTYMEKHPECDVQGPKLLYSDGSVQHSARKFPKFSTLLKKRLGMNSKSVGDYLLENISLKKPIKVDWVCGGCMMFKIKYLLDESFFIYFEDVAFGKGKHVIYNPTIRVTHYAQHASQKKLKYFLIHSSSMIKYYLKYGGKK